MTETESDKPQKDITLDELLESIERPAKRTRAQKDLSKLVDADQLIEMLFDAPSRPSKRTIWNWTRQGFIPVIKIGVSVFFDPVAVKAALEKGKPRLRAAKRCKQNAR